MAPGQSADNLFNIFSEAGLVINITNCSGTKRSNKVCARKRGGKDAPLNETPRIMRPDNRPRHPALKATYLFKKRKGFPPPPIFNPSVMFTFYLIDKGKGRSFESKVFNNEKNLQYLQPNSVVFFGGVFFTRTGVAK